MARWLAPALGAGALLIALTVGVVVWVQQGEGGGGCDRAALAAAVRDGIALADERGQAQWDVVFPARCGDDDLADVLPEVTRGWHMMPGGTLMREPSHNAPTP